MSIKRFALLILAVTLEACAVFAEEGNTLKKVVIFSGFQGEFRQTCEWLAEDGQLEPLKKEFARYEDTPDICQGCRALVRVWVASCKVVPKKAIPKKTVAAKKKEPENEAGDEEAEETASTEDGGEEETAEEATIEPTPTPVVPKVLKPRMASTPATELLNVLSRISARIAPQIDDYATVQDFLDSVALQAPPSSKEYFTILFAYLESAWPERTSSVEGKKVEQHEEKEAILDNLF